MKSKKRFRKIYVEISNRCNLSCQFCSPVTRTLRTMSVAEFDSIATQIAPLTDLIFLHVKGEPLLHPHFEEILRSCHTHKLAVNLTTNGLLLSKVGEDFLKASFLRQINISLHSLAVHKQQDYLEQIWAFVNANESRELPLYISLRLWNYTGGKNNGSNRGILDAIEKEFKVTLAEDILQRREGIKLGSHLYLNRDFIFTWPEISHDLRGRPFFCPGLRDQIAILADGTVTPCCLDSNGVIELGNIFEQGIGDILVSERCRTILEGFSRNKAVEELCKRCNSR